MGNILLMGEKGYYNVGEVNKDKNLIGTDKHNRVNARELTTYGLPFEFGPSKEVRFTLGRLSNENIALKEEDLTKKNFELTINSLENMVKEKGADYILINDFHRHHEGFYGEAQLLLNIKYPNYSFSSGVPI
jgi:hypothetical protein